MTDICLVNNVYYDSTRYNATSVPVPASTDDNLLYPLLNKADDWSVAINKASLDLSTIPLTQSNIPLKTYQVGLQVGANQETAYVRQVGANQNNYVWNCPKTSTTITKYSYASSGSLTQVSSQSVNQYMNYVHTFVVDDHQNLYIAGSNFSEEYADTLYIIDENNNLIQENAYTFIKHLYLDRHQNLYVTDESPTPSVYIYQTNASIGSVSLDLLATLQTNHAGQPLANILFAIADANEIIVGYNTKMITLYNSQYQPQTDITLSTYKQLAPAANIDSVAQTYLLADRSEIDDALLGTSAGNIYRLNDNQQITQWTFGAGGEPVISAGAYVDSGYLFAIGSNKQTYVMVYPQSSYPQELNNANYSTELKAGCIFSSQKNSTMYALDVTNNYSVWNFNIGAGQAFPNTWSAVGQIELASVPAEYPACVDVQTSTNRLLAVGLNNSLYQSTYAVAPIELLFIEQNSPQVHQRGLNSNDASGNQDHYPIVSLNGSAVNQGMFNSGQAYYVVENNTDLVVRRAADYSIAETNNIGMTMNNITYLPLSHNFVFNSGDYCYVYDLNTYTMKAFYSFANVTYGGYAELGSDYFCTFTSNEFGNFIYVFRISTQAYTCIQNLGSNVIVDIASNTSDTSVNGATALFAIVSSTGDPNAGNSVIRLAFTDNTYTAFQPSYQPTIYSGSNLTSIFCHTGTGRLMFFSGNTLYTVFQSSSYDAQYKLNAEFPTESEFSKPFICLNQATTQTSNWTLVNTGGMGLLSVSVSRSNPNRLYAIGSADNLLYSGTLNNENITFTRISEITQTYDYISNIKNDDPLVLQSTLHLYNTQNQSLIASTVVDGNVPSIARNDVANQYIVSESTNNNLVAFNPLTLAVEFTQALNGVYNIMAKNGDDIDVGPVNIYNMSVFIDAVNAALLTAYNRLNGVAPGSLSEPPTITLNYQTGLVTLNYVSALAQVGNGITFNSPLMSLIYFYNVSNQIVLNPTATSITQTSKTIYNFNQLDKILFQSNTIYVTGSFYGINSSNRIITDIDVPTGDFIDNIGQRLLYQPQFLRPYFLQSNLPLQRIQLDILYAYRDGTQNNLMISQGQNFTTKIQFVKKF